MSCRKFSARQMAATSQTDRQQFAQVWSEIIQANFESAAEVAVLFRVDPSTAENWWTGANAPQGWVLFRAMRDPTLRAETLARLGDC